MSDLYTRVNYSSDISYLNNVFIYELDISKANINILYTLGAINKETYDYLYSAERMVRQVYIGKLMKNDKEIIKILKAGIITAKKMLFEANNIQDYEVLSIKNDAVFLINRIPQIRDFGLIHFAAKNKYTGYYKLRNLELYYYYSSIDKEEYLDAKGVNKESQALHEQYMIQFFKDLFYTIQCNGVEVAMRLLKDFYLQYISYSLPIGYYRRFGMNNDYHFKIQTGSGAGYCIDNATEEMKPMIDISHNLNLILDLQRILVDMYFIKN